MGGTFLSLLALPLCLIFQQTPPGSSAGSKPVPPAPPTISWQTSGEITVPFEYFQQHIYVTVSLNGKPGFIFMLDSGANRNVLNLQTAERLGMKPNSMGQEKKIGFGSGFIYTAPEKQVNAEIGSMSVARVMSVLDLNRFAQHFNHPTDGMLGYPFLRHFVVRLDFQRKLLTLSPAEHYRYRGLGVQVSLRPSKDFVVIPVTVGSSKYVRHQIDALVDSGSNMMFMLYRPYVKSLKLENNLNRAQPGQGYGLNGPYLIALGRIDSLQIGYAETHNLPVDFLEKEEQLASTRNIPGAIGNGILQSFPVVIFDVPHQRMIFEVKPPPWQSGVERTESAP